MARRRARTGKVSSLNSFYFRFGKPRLEEGSIGMGGQRVVA